MGPKEAEKNSKGHPHCRGAPRAERVQEEWGAYKVEETFVPMNKLPRGTVRILYYLFIKNDVYLIKLITFK